MSERPRVTLADVAAAAGVSTKTASLALRGDTSVARHTRARLHDLARQLGYTARGARRQVIGVVVPYIGHRVYSDLFGFLRREAASYELTALLAEGLGDPSTEKNLLAELRWRGADGVILIAPRLSVEDIDRESRVHQPIVTIGMPPPVADDDLGFARIEIDHHAGGRLATEHLLAEGHTRIAYLAGRVPSASDQGRRSGLAAALQAAGMQSDPRLVIELERHTVQPWPDYDLGYEQGARLAAVGAEFDAVLAYSDAIAIGAHRALHDLRQLQVPRDVSMVGFDALRVAQFIVPKLTSVGFAWYRVALAALEMLIELMDSPRDRPLEAMRFAPELIPGESVRTRSGAHSRDGT
jgi:DNA-binding LacI/PurR family transcriptional regulator